MPSRSLSRRGFLATTGTSLLGTLAGCASSTKDENNYPVGSLQFVNEHSLPHTIGVRVTDVAPMDGSEHLPPDSSSQEDISSTVTLDVGETRTYAGVFTESVQYDLTFTLDGQADRSVMQFTPFPPDSVENRSLRLVVGTEGRLLGFQTSVGGLE